MAREIGGAESTTTSEKDALRRRTSAHHAAFTGCGGRTIHSVPAAASAQSRGASVREASIYATHSPRSIAAATTARNRVSLPLAPTTSDRRPRGNPPEASARSSASTPVGSPSACGNGAGSNARSDSTLREERGSWREEAAAELTSGTQLQVYTITRTNTEEHETRKRARQRLLADGFINSFSTPVTSTATRSVSCLPPAQRLLFPHHRHRDRTEHRNEHRLS